MNNVTVDHIFEKWRPLFSCLKFIWLDAGVNHCKVMYEKAAFQRLTDPGEKFDLLITELWGSDCFLPLANVLDVPHISMITTMEVPWSLGRYGSPLNPAHQVNLYLPHSNYAMDFWQRLTNALLTAYMILGHHFYSEVSLDARHRPAPRDTDRIVPFVPATVERRRQEVPRSVRPGPLGGGQELEPAFRQRSLQHRRSSAFSPERHRRRRLAHHGAETFAAGESESAEMSENSPLTSARTREYEKVKLISWHT